MDFDTLLDRLGSWNKYQMRILFFYFLPMSWLIAFRLNFIFVLEIPSHHCEIPMKEDMNMTDDEWNEAVLPRVPGSKAYESCLKYDFNFSSVSDKEDFQKINLSKYQLVGCKGKWVYDQSNFVETMVTLNNWVCDKETYATIIMTVGNVASLIGSLIYGYLADTYLGRKKASYVQIIPTLVGIIGLMFNPPFILHCIFNFCAMMVFPSIFQVSFVLFAEQVSADKRALLNGLSFFFWTLGLCFVALLTWLLHGYWFHILLIEAVLYVVLLMSYSVVGESPRYLVSNQKYEEAVEACTYIAKVNGKAVPENLMDILMKIETPSKEKVSVLHLFKTFKLARRTIAMTFIWLCCGVTYTGLQMNVSNLGGNPFLNYFFLSAVELISFFIGMYLMTKIGRRATQSGFLLLTTLICVTNVILPAASPEEAFLTLCIIAKLGITVNFLVTYQQALEIYPTVLRSVGMALGSACSQGFGMLTPTIVYLGHYWRPTPFIVFGLALGISFSFSLLLPETYNKALPETIDDANSFGDDQHCCSFNLEDGAELKKEGVKT